MHIIWGFVNLYLNFMCKILIYKIIFFEWTTVSEISQTEIFL